MTKRTFEGEDLNSIKERVVCIIGEPTAGRCIRRLFSTEEKAQTAREKISAHFGKRIAVWVRPLSKEELKDLYVPFEGTPWHGGIIDDDGVFNIVTIKIMRLWTMQTDKKEYHENWYTFHFFASDADRAFAGLQKIADKKNENTHRSHLCVLMEDSYAWFDIKNIDTVESALKKFE